MKQYLYDYCVGCGLCQSLNKAELSEDDNGYLHPVSGDEDWLKKVCPAGGAQQTDMDFSRIWGRVINAYYGFSADEHVRKIASSGGAVTEIASWLLESGAVDAVLHVCQSDVNPTETMVCVSSSREQIIDRSGSRYSISHPLEKFDTLELDKKYLFIGKPCDVTALKNYLKLHPELNAAFPVTVSFFCAGLPSRKAQEKLLHEMDCRSKVVSLKYRGNGWLGYATAVEDNGDVHYLDYDTAWGKILGRDIMKMCRFCLDGIGESADISCCDAWYLDSDNKPDFSEAEGRNAIFVRTEKGARIISELAAGGKLHIEKFDDYETKMKYMQNYQYQRRATMASKILALKLAFKSAPQYKSGILKYSRHASMEYKYRIFKGTLSRIVKGKI